MAAHMASLSLGQRALDFSQHDNQHKGRNVMSAFTNDAITEDLILDSGATDHVFPHREQFEEYNTKVPAETSSVRTEDGRIHPVVGVGLVKVAFQNGASVRQVHLQALHVPSIGQNLVSMICLNDRARIGFTLSENGVPSLFWRGQKFADVKRHECGLLVMPGRVVRNEKVVRARRGSKMGGTAECEKPRTKNLKSILGALGDRTGCQDGDAK